MLFFISGYSVKKTILEENNSLTVQLKSKSGIISFALSLHCITIHESLSVKTSAWIYR